MILILINWLFVSVITFSMGFILVKLIRKITGNSSLDIHVTHLFLCGFIFVTVLCNILNYFFSINNWLVFAVSSLSVLSIFFFRKEAYSYLKYIWQLALKKSIFLKFSFLILFLIALIKSSAPTELSDEPGYYLPYLRWIEGYKLVPGIANISDRFGYDSSVFVSEAFFSLKSFYSDGFYDLNSFLLIIFAAYFLGGLDNLIKGKGEYKASDIVKVFCLFFLLRNMLTSSASDFANVFFAEMVMILTIEIIESGKIKTDESFYILLLYSLFLITIKLSSCLLVLCWIYLFFQIFKFNKKMNYMFIGSVTFIILFPWFLRNYFLSGYLVYPLFQIDLFNPDWKVPIEIAKAQYYYFAEAARGNTDDSFMLLPIEKMEYLSRTKQLGVWIPKWFLHENGFNKITILALFTAVCVFSLSAVFRFKKWFREHLKLTIILLIILVNVVFWFFNHPAFRFGWPFVIVFIALTLFLISYNSKFKNSLRYFTIVLFLFFTLQSFYKSIRESKSVLVSTLVYPAKLPTTESTTKVLDGIIVNYADYHCSGTSAPCFTRLYNLDYLSHFGYKIQARGSNVEDGFRSVKSDSVLVGK